MEHLRPHRDIKAEGTNRSGKMKARHVEEREPGRKGHALIYLQRRPRLSIHKFTYDEPYYGFFHVGQKISLLPAGNPYGLAILHVLKC